MQPTAVALLRYGQRQQRRRACPYRRLAGYAPERPESAIYAGLSRSRSLFIAEAPADLIRPVLAAERINMRTFSLLALFAFVAMVLDFTSAFQAPLSPPTTSRGVAVIRMAKHVNAKAAKKPAKNRPKKVRGRSSALVPFATNPV